MIAAASTAGLWIYMWIMIFFLQYLLPSLPFETPKKAF
jgi:hypothetical protein